MLHLERKLEGDVGVVGTMIGNGVVSVVGILLGVTVGLPVGVTVGLLLGLGSIEGIKFRLIVGLVGEFVGISV